MLDQLRPLIFPFSWRFAILTLDSDHACLPMANRKSEAKVLLRFAFSRKENALGARSEVSNTSAYPKMENRGESFSGAYTRKTVERSGNGSCYHCRLSLCDVGVSLDRTIPGCVWVVTGRLWSLQISMTSTKSWIISVHVDPFQSVSIPDSPSWCEQGASKAEGPLSRPALNLPPPFDVIDRNIAAARTAMLQWGHERKNIHFYSVPPNNSG